MVTEEPLSDGFPSVGEAMLVDGLVHRAVGPWTPAVHSLLSHLEQVGFDGAPRVVGFDERGREILTWVDGLAPSHPWPGWMATDDALAALGGLLRRYHEAVAAFVPPADAQWRSWLGSPGGPIIRHGDLWPANVVFRDGLPAAFIDFEFAQPGTVVDDLASAAKHWIPLADDDRAHTDGFALPLDRARRLRILCDGYGAGDDLSAQLVPIVIRNAQFGYLSHKTWGEAGLPGFKEMWEAGSGASILSDRDWLVGEEGDLARFLDRAGPLGAASPDLGGSARQ